MIVEARNRKISTFKGLKVLATELFPQLSYKPRYDLALSTEEWVKDGMVDLPDPPMSKAEDISNVQSYEIDKEKVLTELFELAKVEKPTAPNSKDITVEVITVWIRSKRPFLHPKKYEDYGKSLFVMIMDYLRSKSSSFTSATTQ